MRGAMWTFVLTVLGAVAVGGFLLTITADEDRPPGPSAGDETTTTVGTATTTVPATTSAAPTTTSSLAPTTTSTAAPPDVACRDAGCLAGTGVDYLVVTRPIFIDALGDFLSWKEDSGFSVGLLTVDWLDAEFEGAHTAERMKTGMHRVREASGHDAVYALLVGDTEVPIDDVSVDSVVASYDLAVPWNTPTGFYRRIDNDPERIVLPSDAYFTEDADWDRDGSGLNAVGGDWGQGSMTPSIYVGRWSVRDPAEIAPIVAKTMEAAPARSMLVSADATNFENASCCDRWPPNDAYFGTGTRACCYLDLGVIVERALEPATWITTDFDQVDLTVDDDRAFQRFLGTEGAATFLFHGLYECVAMVHGQCVGADDMRFEDSFSLLEAMGCYIAAFYAGETDTLAEAILKRPTGPAVVSQAGHNPYGYFTHLVEGRPVGEAFWMPAEEYVYWLNPILLLGDPSLVVVAGPGT